MSLRRSARARQPSLRPDYVNPDDIFGGQADVTRKAKINKSYHDDFSNNDPTPYNSLVVSTTDSKAENSGPSPLNYALRLNDKPIAEEGHQSWIEERKEYDHSTILNKETFNGDTTDLCDANISRHSKSKMAKRKACTQKEKRTAFLKAVLNHNQRRVNKNSLKDSNVDTDSIPINLSSKMHEAEGSTAEVLPKSDSVCSNRETTAQKGYVINNGIFDVETEGEHDNFSSGNEDEGSDKTISSNGVNSIDKGAENEESTLDVILDCESDDNEEDNYYPCNDSKIDNNSSLSDFIPFDPEITNEGAISYCDNQIPALTSKLPRILKCPYCQYLAMKSSHLKRHVRKHTGERPFKCPHCKYSAMRKEHLLRHFGFKHKELLRVSCRECRYRTTDEESLNVHLKLSHPEIYNQVYKCRQCEFESPRKSQYVEHTKVHRVWECPICKYSTQDWMTYRQHKRSHTEERPYTCPMCTYTAKLKVDLERHIRAHTGERPFTCPQCSYRGARKDSLIRHMRTHTGDKPYKCPLCDFASAQQGHLVTHIRTHTGERPFTCPCCDYACCDRSSLVKHVRIHTGERPYKCPHCPFAAIRNQDLKDHINIHTGERPYKCTQCLYAAADRSTLRTHTKKHDRKARFACKQCEFSCACKATLVKHLKKHKVTRPFKCSECDYTTSNKACLKRHQKQHDVDTLSCKMCDLEFNKQQELITHIATHIKEDPERPPPQHGGIKTDPDAQDDLENQLSFQDVSDTGLEDVGLPVVKQDKDVPRISRQVKKE
ncbi:zinc finger protein 572-like [Branchiostoma floridae]|uniref:Zinc finger protein 572-like n=1 Tax=Branchiostoma floridae TaxID=7739 RepID=A0A9J7HUS8_BRAFL|nr:zinc finger protein 572-like [Branchiostoma floridae]